MSKLSNSYNSTNPKMQTILPLSSIFKTKSTLSTKNLKHNKVNQKPSNNKSPMQIPKPNTTNLKTNSSKKKSQLLKPK